MWRIQMPLPSSSFDTAKRHCQQIDPTGSIPLIGEVSTLRVIVDLCIVPLGTEPSLSPYVAACERVLAEAGLKIALHANGTNIEGEWDDVFAAIKRCHETVHAMGAPRIYSTIKVNTRTDKEQTLEDKIASVEAVLNPGQ